MIYCIEDDDNIRDLIIYTLKNTGFEAKGFADGKSCIREAMENIPELLLLDIMLPGEDGMDILRTFRETKVIQDVPIIMVTAKGSEYDKVKALDLGADDYVTKPFGMMELVSRIKAVLRRAGKSVTEQDDDAVTLGDIRMDLKRHEVRVGNEEVHLTLKEFELLRMLMLNAEVVLTRDQLLTSIWGYDFDGETRTVDVHVGSLRQKLGSAGDHIETIRGVGYKIR